MKTRLLACALLAPLFLSASVCLAQSADNNGGILNGPLTDRNLGHRAAGHGNKESLQLAIEDLIKTHGDAYPKGEEFLKRLEADVMNDANSAEFKALQREALLVENPVIDFDSILVVKANQGGRRYSENWQTRVSCEGETRTVSERDVQNVLNRLRGQDKTIATVYGEFDEANREYNKRRKELEGTQAFKSERDRGKRDAMYTSLPAYSALQSAKDKLHQVGMKHREYADLHKKWQEKAQIAIYDDELVKMALDGTGKTTTIYRAKPGKFIGDVDLHFNSDKILFSSFRNKSELSAAPGKGLGYAVCEILVDPKTGAKRGDVRVVSPDMGADVDCYDACYLPDGRIIFASTAAYEGVPCVGGGSYVANLYRMNNDGTDVRRLTFDQDASWHPAVMENGRVMFTRWEYTDSAHYFSRVLMHMNPDGTDQKGFYGSNSYWPNSMFYARQIPGKQNMFVSTITGHHSNAKGGALCIFDVSKGRHEADGAVQFLTGRGKKVEPLVIDGLHSAYSPMFYNPYPINEKYYFATTGGKVYLLDVFDNMIMINAEDDRSQYYEPVPFKKTKMPFVRRDTVRPGEKVATVLISNIYEGPGLSGVPQGTVKDLRVYRYEYGPRHKGGHYSMGMEAGWDAKQVLGTAPVEDDGSVSFKVPANTPFAMQPLDKDGKALQLMRSWTVVMPGETLACLGCHESPNMPPPTHRAKAMYREPSDLEPFYGPTRGFSFEREIQPIMDKYCVSCHDGSKDIKGLQERGVVVADRITGTGANTGKRFSEVGIPDLSNSRAAHTNLHPYVRRNGPEGDYHLLTPLEFHAGTSELVQMLKKGHHNVKLNEDSWRRIYTWMDLNAPYHGTWTEAGASKDVLQRRLDLRKLYASDDYNPELIFNPYEKTEEVVIPEPVDRSKNVQPEKPVVSNKKPSGAELDLGDGVTMKFVGIPAGEFSMGSNDETPVEQPVHRVKIDKGFMMGATEVTLEQYRQFDPDYLNGVYDMHYKDQVKRGYYMNDMQFPVIRVNWQDAVAYCEWLSKKTGKKVSLPTEAQWEWACRAGTETPLNYGDLDTDFSKHANLADLKTKEMAVSGVNPKPINNPNHSVDFKLKDPRFNDNVLHLAEVGSFAPNKWGLYDMHGNVAEWTRTAASAYPYKDDGRNSLSTGARRVIRGGSWHDRPFRSTSTYRLDYPDWQRVYHTGFRVVIED